jgi:hypothetical protein
LLQNLAIYCRKGCRRSPNSSRVQQQQQQQRARRQEGGGEAGEGAAGRLKLARRSKRG